MLHAHGNRMFQEMGYNQGLYYDEHNKTVFLNKISFLNL